MLHLVQPETMRAKLIVEGVSKRFLSKRATVDALDNVSLAVAEGEFLCLIGPSGCGKSTLLDIMAGPPDPTAGRWLPMGSVCKALAGSASSCSRSRRCSRGSMRSAT
jgi:ABC-type sugar transport system ATPase subunit